jgi:catechol 2,3-dioxygenase-like lactoylglutathione lyase family enzyme
VVGTAVVRETQLKLASVVMFVSALDRSVAFYCDLLHLEPTVRNNTAALLVGAPGWQLYLRALGNRATHASGGIGPQYVLWSAQSLEDLERCEARLREQSTHVSVTQHEGYRLLEGRDPDGLPVIITFPGPDELPRTEIISRIYDW